MRLTASVFRAHHPGWAFARSSGDGAARHGGRFNRKGQKALYTSLSMEGAWTEAQQAFPFKAQSMTLCAYAVDCADIADLTDPQSCTDLGIASSDLACAWEDLADRGQTPPSWTLADRLIAAGIAGIVVPSFASAAGRRVRNVVFWDWAKSGPHQVSVIDDLMR